MFTLTITVLLASGIVYLAKHQYPLKFFYWTRLTQIYVMFALVTLMRLVRNLLQGVVKVEGFSANASVITKEWLRSVLQQHFKTVPAIVGLKVERGTLHGGLTGELQKLLITWPDATTQQDHELPDSLVMKTARPSFRSYVACAFLGSAREALFYNTFVMEHGLEFTPKVYYSEGSMFTGEYLILMEDLSSRATPGGHLFGNQCWGAVTLPRHVEQNPIRVLEVLFQNSADLHARFWRKVSLLQTSWIKTTDYLKGENRVEWEFAIERMRGKWKALMRKVKNNQTTVKWSEAVRNEMEHALKHSSWSRFQSAFDTKKETTAFTLCHGDFHAGNTLWLGEQCSTPAILVDWAEVCVFCPFTDLAQFLVSHLAIDLRRKHEYELFKLYHKRLVTQGVCERTFPLDKCWERYKFGGIERWLSVLTVIASINPKELPEHAVQWFHNQVSAFIEDHGTCDTVLYTTYPY